MNRVIILIFLFFALVSCTKNQVYQNYKSVNGIWNKDTLVVLNFEPKDTVTTHNIFIMLRNDNTYAFSNLFLISELQFPNGKVVKDTLEYQMANPDGTWLGTRKGGLVENKLWYKENVSFQESGNYKFKIKQAMRQNGSVEPVADLKGILDVGVLIEKAVQ